MYTVKLSDGTQIEHLELNGNNYISQDTIEAAFFEGKLGDVEIVDEDNPETPEKMEHCYLVQCMPWHGGTAFILAERTEEELAEAAREQDITDLQLALAEIYESLMS